MHPLISLSILLITFNFSATIAQAQQAEAVDPIALKRALSSSPALLDASGKPAQVWTKSADPEKSRTYTKSATVRITRRSGLVEERKFVALPILFKVGTAELLSDGVSAENVIKTVEVLRDLISSEKASFCIEGHASVEGNPAVNQSLSADRATKILSLLTASSGIPENALTARGFGSKFATASEADGEAALQHDRRVLIVRTK